MRQRTRSAVVSVGAALVAMTSLPGSLAQEAEVQLVKVVGCLRQDSDALPFVIERATEATPATTPYTSEEEVSAAADQALGTLEYRLLGVSEFEVEPHVGHKVQAKGLQIVYDGELRLNLTSFQHVAPDCSG